MTKRVVPSNPSAALSDQELFTTEYLSFICLSGSSKTETTYYSFHLLVIQEVTFYHRQLTRCQSEKFDH